MPNKLYSEVNPQNASGSKDDGREAGSAGSPSSVDAKNTPVPNEGAPRLAQREGAEGGSGEQSGI